jgi:hypothetical protein
MNAQLPPEPPRYDIDEETKNLLTMTIEYAVQVARMQTNDTAQLEIRALVDEVCERFNLVTEETEYDIEELDNGDIYWRLIGSKTQNNTPKPLTLVTDNTNVTQFPGNHNDSDS